MTKQKAPANFDPTGAARIREIFDRQLNDGLHPAAALAVYTGDRLALDMVGGIADPSTGVNANGSTLFRVFSCGKPLAAATLWVLHDRGLVEWDTPVAHYWPRFGRHGKSGVTIRHVLTHTAGLPTTPANLGLLDFAYWDRCIAAMEEARLEYEPGSRIEYHEYTFGWLVGELTARISSQSFEEFFTAEVARPLGLENTYFRVPARRLARVAKILSMPGFDYPHIVSVYNMEDSYAVMVPAGSCVSTARDMARFSSVLVCDGTVDGVQWLKPTTVAEVTSQHATHVNEETGRRSRVGLGVWLAGSTPNAYAAEDGSATLGHGGLATCTTWGDPESGLAVAYLTTGMQPDPWYSGRPAEISRTIRNALIH
ncbi:MAG: serine hydrolase domain-containing protein [Dehalococcoidia bacterium]